jgi:RimJ/RimL family protein N-acetyltransferase
MGCGNLVRLRPLDRCHLEATRSWANDQELARLLDRAWPVTDVEHERWFAALPSNPDCSFHAVETVPDGRHVGNVWLHGIDWRHRKAEVRIVLGDRSGTGRGLGPEALQLICRHAFERLNLHKVYAYVLDFNPPARRAFEKAGFTVEGVLREDRWAGDRYCDVYLLARLRSAESRVAQTDADAWCSIPS